VERRLCCEALLCRCPSDGAADSSGTLFARVTTVLQDGLMAKVTTPNVVAGKSVVHVVDEVGGPSQRR
jgi:hypothetical protein